MPIIGTTQKEDAIRLIVERITKAVCEQRLAPGTRLVEAQLVQAFSANRNHVRAALQRLALRKIVTIESNRGATVSAPSVNEAQDIFKARAIIECGVIELLSSTISVKAIDKLQKHLELEKKTIARGIRKDVIAASGEFHLLLARLTGNDVLAELLEDLLTRSSLILSLYQKDTGSNCGCDEHQSLIEALISKDKERAITYMNDHLKHIEQSLNLEFWTNKKVDLVQALKP